jgi:hypothetical protein
LILIDLNQVMISTLMAQIGNHHNTSIDENMLRHMILNTIRSYKSKFSPDFGEIIICADDKNYWRRKVFPYYKASRKKSREESELDWNSIFTSINKIKEELNTVFPYKVIQIESAEADDIIGTICHLKGQIIGNNENILIISSDKDYIQLHQYTNVKQYDSIKKKWITHSSPLSYLKEHIMKGDVGDGIPNILSPDNCFVIGERQKPLTKKRQEEFVYETSSEQVQRNFKRNENLIDLSKVPEYIKEKVIAKFEEENTKDRSKLLNFFMEKNLRNLMECITEF